MIPAERRFFYARRAGLLLLSAAGVWLLLNLAAFIDVSLRARSAYLEGMKYLKWHESPEVKKAALDRWLERSESKLGSSDDRDLLQESLRMQYKIKMEDNDAKNAYYWFKTAIECFQPPRSSYVKKAEEQIKVAEELWNRP
ncbi:MAG: hypothetical protein COS41_05275 [Elusimicrobia bacterium CG03_land_8_20_14_0_80_50_18]|nr:MAG: hypothetical protein COS41_05275 [Elusimicrobia bacterium CG03_land_8_20_14_0_80_50_18]PIX15421.1 MAG: hypothetical protein COZ72_03515 [Elusimicrobia bacterium CG_4_8_14_3_um_filter_50_9]